MINPQTKNQLARALGIELAIPIIQAPMAGVQGSGLAAAVSNAGGLGSLPAAMLTNVQLNAELLALSKLCDKPYNVNFFVHQPPLPDAEKLAIWHQRLAPFYAEYGITPPPIEVKPGRAPFSHEVADLLEPYRPAVVSFHFGLPKPDLLARVKSWGSAVLSSATTVAEARWLVAHGADAIIAQGLEAGGHRGVFLTNDPVADAAYQIGTFALLPQIVAAVNVPVIAAGGIADAAGVAAAMRLGAAAAQIGTAFLLSDEATTSIVHRRALQSEAGRRTALTSLFTGRPARGIVNRMMFELGNFCPDAPDFPMAGAASAPLRAAAEKLGIGDFSPLWSGQNNAQCLALPAQTILHKLALGLGQHI